MLVHNAERVIEAVLHGMQPQTIHNRKRAAARKRKMAKTGRGKKVRKLFDEEAFVDNTLKEDSCEAELGFDHAFDDLEPRDSKGKPYLRICWVNGKRKLYQVRSDEYHELPAVEQRLVRKRAVTYYRIKQTQK